MSDKNISFSMLVDERWGRPLAIQIAEMLAERIISGEVKAGERLKEAELANMFGTSRAPVREAAYLLQIDGLVEHVPRRGAIVRGYSDQDIEDLYDVRRALECAAIDRLGPRWDEGMEREFKAILCKMKLAVMNSDSKTYSQCNTEFHRHLFKLANSNILMRLYEQLGHPLKFLLDISTRSRSDMDVSLAEHVAIVENLQGKEIDRAKALLTANVRHGLDRVLTTRSNLPK